jgi:ubiquinone/menaquinone biosynthesis C-methylase UbiE
MNQAQQIIDTWRFTDSANYKYFDDAEKDIYIFWGDKSPFLDLFKQLNLTNVVEIACGKGRHAGQIVDQCGRLTLVDTSIDAVAFAKQRFKERRNVECILSTDGESLSFVPECSVTAVYCYDAMVHFELFTIASYLNEIRRILIQGGRAVLHISNYSGNPAGVFKDNPAWRNFMSKDLFTYLSSRAELKILSYIILDWAEHEKSDAVVLLES